MNAGKFSMGHLFLSSKYQACQIFICISSREDGDASWSQAQLEVGATRETFAHHCPRAAFEFRLKVKT